MPRYLVIDGYNAINKITFLKAKRESSLECSRNEFIRILQNFLYQKKTFSKVFLVFDSKEEALGVCRHKYGNVEVLFANSYKDADKVIVDILRKVDKKDSVTVASDDNFVRNHAKVFICDTITIKELENIIMLKKDTLRSKINLKEKSMDNDHIKDINEELKKHWRLI
ncbi:MAG: NYN domain-containing protein [Candidatus Omnitrophota bacterium]